MKFLHVSMMLLVILLSSGCNDNNSYDGKEGLIGSAKVSNKDTFASIEENVFLANAQALVESASRMMNDVETIETKEDLIQAQNSFKSLVVSLKSVEASYVAGDFNASLIDTLRFVDIFHEGNEDIVEQLENIASSDSDVASVMYKNSHKSINALEYMLFKYGEDTNKTLSEMQANPRRIEMLSIIAKAIEKHVASIELFYASSDFFAKDEEASTDALLNVLIDSTYKLKEWRIGEPAGLTNKYKNDPNATRLEYNYSADSTEAILAILKTYSQLMKKQTYDNFATYLITRGAQNEVDLANEHIATAISLLESMSPNIADDLESTKMRELYESIQALYSVFYTSLPAVLAQSGNSINIGIIEADGD